MDYSTWEAGIDYPTWQSEEALATLCKGYLQPGETPMKMYERLVNHSAFFYENVLTEKQLNDYKTALYSMFVMGWFSPATPVAANFGVVKENGQPTKNFGVSCFSIHLNNSIDSIFKKVHEGAMLSKRGGGLGCYLGDVVGSTSVHHWGAMFDRMAATVSQSGTRRGSVALYVDIEHPDIEALIRSKEFDQGGDLREKIDSNIAVCIPDSFMEKVVTMQGKEFELFCKVLDLRMKTGSPYLMFTDNANNQAPQLYKDQNMKISTSNLCLVGDTLVVTKEGFKPIKDLVGGTHTIWNGKKWVENDSFLKTNSVNKIVRIHLTNGMYIDSTEYHVWHTEHKKPVIDKYCQGEQKRAFEIKPGDRLMPSGVPDFTEIGHIDVQYPVRDTAYSLSTVGLLPKNVLEWTYFDRCAAAMHFIHNHGRLSTTQITMHCDVPDYWHDEVIQQLYHLLVSINIRPKYNAKNRRFGFPAKQAELLKKYLGGNDWEKAFPEMKSRNVNVHHVTQETIVKELELIEYEEPIDVYCTHEPEEQKFALGMGCITGNCSEIFQYTDADHTFICVLSSLNLLKWDVWKDFSIGEFDTVKTAIFFLDSVCEDFIQKAESQVWNDDGTLNQEAFLPALRSAKKGRALGLGTMGLHAYYMHKGYPFQSEEARIANKLIHSYINGRATEASKDLANLLGEPEWCYGYGLRNSVTMAIAPTTSNSLLSGAITPGVEPIHGNIYTKIGAKGTFVRENPALIQLLEEKGVDMDEVKEQITRDQGSVKNVNCLTASEKDIFKTFEEINPFEIVKQAADRQKYIDQGQSLNLYLKHDISVEELFAVHVYAWKMGLKALYYVRSDSSTKKASKQQNIFTQSDTTVDSTDKVVIYSRPDCIYCNWAKMLLDERRIPYDEIHKADGKVPKIIVNDEEIGGCTELYEYYQVSPPWEEEGCSGCDG